MQRPSLLSNLNVKHYSCYHQTIPSFRHLGNVEHSNNMVDDLNGNSIWLSVGAFQRTLLPKPPSRLMLSAAVMRRMTSELKALTEQNDERARKRKMKNEDVLAEDFVCVPTALLGCASAKSSFGSESSTSTFLVVWRERRLVLSPQRRFRPHRRLRSPARDR